MKKITLLVVSLLFLTTSFVVGQTVTDIDGNVYQTQVVGDQEWMIENLRVSKYRNGEDILTNMELDQWKVAAEGIWANYENNPSNDALYGKLYNWYAVADSRGLCPTGWRVPTDNDWQKLVLFIDATAWGNNNSVGGKLKSRRQVNSPLGGEFDVSEHPRWDAHGSRFGTDDYGFGVLPAGALTIADGFANLGGWAYLWSSTVSNDNHVWVRTLLHSHRGMSRSLYPKEMGLSVRCIKGDDPDAQVPQVTTAVPTDITITSAILGGVVSSNGGLSVTDRGVVWNATHNPTLENNLGQASGGSGVGEFSQIVEAFTAGQTYWVSAYATNAAGTAYGIQKKLDIPLTASLPIVNTVDVTDITFEAAKSGGEIVSNGAAQITSRGVVWSTNPNPTIDTNDGITSDGVGSGSFISNLTGLNSETIYYVRAYATNSVGTTYGSELQFETTKEVILYSLSLDVNPLGTGTATGAGSYEAGEGLDLLATPEAGYQFVNWTLDGSEVSTNASYTYTMPDGDVTLVANFEEIPATQYSLSISINPVGTGTATGAGSYEAGDGVALVATPEAGYQFVNWTLEGSEVSTSASYTYTMPDGDVTLVANFEEIPATQYTLDISINPVGTGTATGAGSYEAGEGVDLLATPEVGYQFVNWTLDGSEVSTNASYTYTMPEGDVTLVANFEEIPATQYSLSISINPVGTGTATGAGSYEAGDGVSLLATPEAGYQFVNWTLEGSEVSTNASFTYTMPDGDVTLVANFEEIPATQYTLSISINPVGTGNATGAGSYEAGDGVALVATPEAGYQFVNWTLDGAEVSTSASYTYTMPEGDVTLVANFQEQSSVEDGDPCPDAPTVTDYDDNVYNTVYIGGQCWIRENLKTTHYSNGDPIVKDTDWASATTGVYGVYSFASISGLSSEQEVLDAYGALYNWYAVDDERGLCPTGWRVATISDWDALGNYVSSVDPNQVGNQLKSCRQLGHPSGGECDVSEHPRWNFNATNSGDDRFNFGGLPAGFRDQSGSFQQVGDVELWWTATSYDDGAARYIEIKVNGSEMVSTFRNAKNYGSSVRCIKE
ncbi:MAG: FISUMP domain-containing protein [Tenuifilaceae bacterium]|nr:FISUMP domain-containing protein [Tenuifilaceae bacterium]